MSTGPFLSIRGVFGGQESNPDGEIRVFKDDEEELHLYLENKTFRLSLTKQQILNHVNHYCQNATSFLLVITPRPEDYTIVHECIEEVGDKIFFKTWNDIVQRLKSFSHSEKDFISSQFIEYGEVSGEFSDMQLDSNDIASCIIFHSRNITNKIQYIFESISREIDYSVFDDSLNLDGIYNDHVRHGCKLNFENTYGMELFFGVYYNDYDHMIPFKNDSEPELVLFIDIDSGQKNILRSNVQVREVFKRLENYGFESNLFGELTSNQWRLLAHRTSLSQFGDFSIVNIVNHVRNLIQIFYSERDFISLIKTSNTSS